MSLSGVWNINPVHSFITWTVRHAGVSWFRGYFDGLGGNLDATGPEPVLEGSTKVENISIRSPDMFREHILGEDFFDAAKFPDISFRSTKLELRDDHTVAVEGDLTLRGTTKAISGTGRWESAAETPYGPKTAIDIDATINRFDFGVSWEAPPLPTGGPALGEEVQLQLSLQLDPAE